MMLTLGKTLRGLLSKQPLQVRWMARLLHPPGHPAISDAWGAFDLFHPTYSMYDQLAWLASFQYLATWLNCSALCSFTLTCGKTLAVKRCIDLMYFIKQLYQAIYQLLVGLDCEFVRVSWFPFHCCWRQVGCNTTGNNILDWWVTLLRAHSHREKLWTNKCVNVAQKNCTGWMGVKFQKKSNIRQM